MRCALVCIAKDEDDYIREWAEYHLKIGFDDIYILQNNWRCKHAFESSNVHLETYDGLYIQVKAYNDALCKLHDKYDWIAFFDVDEFLSFSKTSGYNDIRKFLSQDKYSSIPCMCVNWRTFGDNGNSFITTFDVLSRFTRCSAALDESSKPIVHTGITKDNVKFFYNSHTVTSTQHDPNLKFVLNNFGNNKSINNDGNIEPLELNHYRNKTYAEQFKRHFGVKNAIPVNIDPASYRNDLKKFNEEFDRHNTNEMTNTNALDLYRSLQMNCIAQHKTLFATNGDIVPHSPLLTSIKTYESLAKDDLLCIPGKNVDTSMPVFGMQAFMNIINYAIRYGYDYVIYVDADCFIWSKENLMQKFREFVDGDYIIGGVPDGGIFCHRNTNSFCINPFLTFFNIKRMKRHVLKNGQLAIVQPTSENDIPEHDRISNKKVLDECKAWRHRSQKDVPYMKTKNFLLTNTADKAYTSAFTLKTEYYYPLFLGLHFNDEKFMWLHGRDYVCDEDKLGLTSGLYVNADMKDDANLICLHTWFSRLLINPEMPDKVLNPREDVNAGLCHADRIRAVMSKVKQHLNA